MGRREQGRGDANEGGDDTNEGGGDANEGGGDVNEGGGDVKRVDFASVFHHSISTERDPIGLYPAHSWVPGRNIGIVGGRRRRIGRGVEVQGPR